MSNAAMKLNETSSDAYEKLEALLSPDVIKLKHYVDKGEYLLVLAKDLWYSRNGSKDGCACFQN